MTATQMTFSELLAVGQLHRAGQATSRAAAVRQVCSGRHDSQCRLVLAALRTHGPSTSRELAERAGLDRHMVGKRLPTIERRGHVLRKGPVQCAYAGRKAILWEAVVLTAGGQP